jgi:hypothetical protein
LVSCEGVADIGDDLERVGVAELRAAVGVAELGAVALVEQRDELAELAHRDLSRASGGADSVAGDRA